jgi:hypothetical protein
MPNLRLETLYINPLPPTMLTRTSTAERAVEKGSLSWAVKVAAG